MSAYTRQMIKDLTDEELAYELTEARPDSAFFGALRLEWQERYERRTRAARAA